MPAYDAYNTSGHNLTESARLFTDCIRAVADEIDQVAHKAEAGGACEDIELNELLLDVFLKLNEATVGTVPALLHRLRLVKAEIARSN